MLNDHSIKKPPSMRDQILAALLGVGVLWFLFAGLDGLVASDTIKQYEMAKRAGSRVEVCVHAGLVKAAFLSGHDQENYEKWSAIERSECQRAGL